MPLAAIVREAVDRYLGRADDEIRAADTHDPADALIGCVEGSAGDESVNHDFYLYGWPKESVEGVELGAYWPTRAGSSARISSVIARRRVVTSRRRGGIRTAPSERPLRPEAGAERAVGVARSLLESRRYELIFLDSDLLAGALAQMARFADKRLSLTDCASFELMAWLGLDSAFSFDRDFRDCGFQMVP